MYRKSLDRSVSSQSGVSLIELVVSLAIFCIIVVGGISLFNLPTKSRGQTLTQIKIQERYIEAFNLFYRAYNQTYVQNSTTLNYVSVIETPTSPTQIQFISSSSAPTITNNTLTIGNGDISLNNLLNYYVVPPVTESVGMCVLTGNASGNIWNYKCPNSYSGINTTFAATNISILPIAFVDGLICYVIAQTSTTLTIDPAQNNCTNSQFNNELSAFSNNWFFELPRILVYSSDRNFQQPIFESLIAPKSRFTTNNNFYPTSY